MLNGWNLLLSLVFEYRTSQLPWISGLSVSVCVVVTLIKVQNVLRNVTNTSTKSTSRFDIVFV